MPELSGKVAIVTGGSRGIGRAIAHDLAKEGAAVMIASRDPAALEQTVGEIKNARGKAASIALDLRLSDTPGKLVAAAIKEFGGLDIVVNNAGATQRGDFLSLTDEQFIDGFALKYYCSVRTTRAAWPHLKARKGSVVNIIGAGGRTPGAHFAIGGSVNAACLAFTKAIAELGIADGVQVNAVNPGPVRTDRQMVWLEEAAKKEGIKLDDVIARTVKNSKITRMGEPEDIAYLVSFIVSKKGSLFQGSLIDMEGGSTKTI
jgi:NAD(P)-dependent dehydrogenase (short-subunit alcohol dehydrogenase family)